MSHRDKLNNGYEVIGAMEFLSQLLDNPLIHDDWKHVIGLAGSNVLTDMTRGYRRPVPTNPATLMATGEIN